MGFRRTKCMVANCTSSESLFRHMTYFDFPPNGTDLYYEWIKLCGLKTIMKSILRPVVCRLHFPPIYANSDNQRLPENLVPTLNLDLPFVFQGVGPQWMTKCIVHGCNNKRAFRADTSLIEFPMRDSEAFVIWSDACRLTPMERRKRIMVICLKHFENIGGNIGFLKPTLFLGNEPEVEPSTSRNDDVVSIEDTKSETILLKSNDEVNKMSTDDSDNPEGLLTPIAYDFVPERLEEFNNEDESSEQYSFSENSIGFPNIESTYDEPDQHALQFNAFNSEVNPDEDTGNNSESERQLQQLIDAKLELVQAKILTAQIVQERQRGLMKQKKEYHEIQRKILIRKLQLQEDNQNNKRLRMQRVTEEESNL